VQGVTIEQPALGFVFRPREHAKDHFELAARNHQRRSEHAGCDMRQFKHCRMMPGARDFGRV